MLWCRSRPLLTIFSTKYVKNTDNLPHDVGNGPAPLARWLRELAGARAEASAAEQIAPQMNEIDAALLRFSSRTNATPHS